MLPEFDDMPLEIRSELLRMTWLEDRELMAIAREVMPADAQSLLAEIK